MNNPIKDNRIVSDYTFARRLRSFISNCSTNSPQDLEEKEYIKSVAEDLLAYQIKTANLKELAYHQHCDSYN